MAKYKIDSNLEKEVKEYMKDVLKKLESDNEKIDDSWSACLYLIAQNYDTVVKCNRTLQHEGLTLLDRFNSIIPHPLIKVKNDAQIRLEKLLIEFLLTKKSAMQKGENTEVDNSPLNQFFANQNKTEKI